MNPGKRISLPALALVLGLAGCGGLQLERETRQGVADANAESAATLRANATDGPVLSEGDPYRIRRYSQLYVSTDSKPVVKPLPPIFTQERFTVNLVDNVFLDDLALIITKISGLGVSLSPELLSGITRDKADVSGEEEEETTSGSETGYQNRLRVSYSDGTLEGLLNYVATAVGISWKYEDGQIKLFRFLTRTYIIASQQGSHSGQATITNRVTGAASGGEETASISGSDLQTQISVETNIWADLQSTIPTLLSEGGRYWVSESSATLTVRDTEVNLSIIGDYVRNLNEILSRQVQFHVRVLSVKQNTANSAGINWDVVYTKAMNQYDFETLPGQNPELNNFSAQILAAKNSPFAGTQLFVDALSTQGDVSEVSNPQLITLNNQPTHLIIGNRRSYLAEVETTVTGTAGTATTSGELADLITGFSLLLQPTILNNSDLQVQIALDRSTLNDLEEVSLVDNAGNINILQAPNVDVSNSIQRVRLKSGQTIVLTGFEQVTNNNARQGLSDPDAWWLGGSKRHASSRTTIVVLLTPVIL